MKQNKKGFMLLELLMAMTIVALIIGSMFKVPDILRRDQEYTSKRKTIEMYKVGLDKTISKELKTSPIKAKVVEGDLVVGKVTFKVSDDYVERVLEDGSVDRFLVPYVKFETDKNLLIVNIDGKDFYYNLNYSSLHGGD